MFKEFFRFELGYWLKKPITYIFFLINFLLVYTAISIENLTLGKDFNNININAPFVIMYYSAFLSLLSIVMTTTFMSRAALKDYIHDFDEILFASPIQKIGYFFGRFFSSFLVACFPLLAVFFAILLVPIFSDSEQVGPVFLSAHLHSFLLFTLPNTLLISTVIFALASLFRNTTGAFVGAIFILIAYLMTGDFISEMKNEQLGILLDPLGINSLNIITKYWTIEDKNTQWLQFAGPILLNRILWMSVAGVILLLAYTRFSFSRKKSKLKKKKNEKSPSLISRFQTLEVLENVSIHETWKARLIQIWTQVKSEFFGATSNRAFMLILLFAIINMLNGISMSDRYAGTGNHPLTYIVLEQISNSLYFFIMVLITYYSGIMVWRERNAKMNEFFDSAPFPSWLPMLSKFLALVGIVSVILTVAMVLGISVQAIKGYDHFELHLYIKQLFLIDLSQFILWIAIALFIQVLCNQMYLGFFVFLAFQVLNVFLWNGLDIDSNLLVIGGVPDFTYSDMSRHLPYVNGLIAYQVYWLLFVGLIVITSILFWVRGKDLSWKNRLAIARQRLNQKLFLTSSALFGSWILLGGFLFYHAEILNTTTSNHTQELNDAAYEQNYKKYHGIPQPKIVALDYHIEMFPEKRAIKTTTNVLISNKHDHPIDSIHFTIPQDFKVTIDISNADLIHEDQTLNYRIFKLNQALQAGDSLSFIIQSDFEPNGIENEVINPRITQNGIFLDKYHFMPSLGYDARKELSNADDRKKHGLVARERMATLSHSCSSACQHNFLSFDSDWLKMSCTIGTSKGQMAIAPGTLVKEWKADGRNYFQYQLNKPVLNFYSFLSAKYEILREKWKDVDLEIYYHKGHEYNVDKMMLSMRKSLSYFDQEFAPYPFKQARIIEFARFSTRESFAQAFPGTMPCAEDAGFIADLKDENDIDRVFFLIAHEMAHQWWGHQVVGARVQGATMLAESFAEYSALMVMEKHYGKHRVKELLEYKMDGYLRSRGGEKSKEMSLLRVEDQAYIHYQKGSVVMYALREYIGENQLNLALRNFVKRTAYQEPPYTTTLVFLEELEKVVPDSLSYLLDDFFENIVLYNNQVVNANYRSLSNGKYEVRMKVKAEKYEADAKGVEMKKSLNDYIYVGVYGESLEDHLPAPILYYEKVKFDQEEKELTFIVDEKPYTVGIDPNHLLIDRIPADNTMEIEEQ